MSGTEGLSATERREIREEARYNIWDATERILASRTAALTAERDALREQVARVEALRDKWADLGDNDSAFWWSTLATHVRAALHPTDGAS